MEQNVVKRLSLADIESVVVKEDFTYNSTLTICTLHLLNGAKVVGLNYGSIDPERQDFTLGKKRARDDAIEKIWELEGYLLRQRLMEAKPVDEQPMYPTQDGRYSIRGGRLVNSVTGVAIPHDEPIMIFRAKDSYAKDHAIRPYTRALIDDVPIDNQTESMKQHALNAVRKINDFEAFEKNHPDRIRWTVPREKA